MEECKKEKIYMILEVLEEKFNPRQWARITVTPPHIFLKLQQHILEQLLFDQKLFNKYFKNFYSNHVKLLTWFMLATDRKSEISPYVFKVLVNNGMMFYNEKIKEVFEDKFHRVAQPKNQQSSRDSQFLQEQVYLDFFNDLLNRNRL